MFRNTVTTLMIAVAIAALISCSGNGTTNPPHFEGDGNNNGVQGNLLPSYVPSGSFPTAPASGTLPDAPLGTDPGYGTQDLADVIETNYLGDGTSSVKSSSQEDRLFWIAVVAHGDEPIEGNVSPPVSEGDEIDLYMRYQVFDTQLTVSRQWYMSAAGLDYIEPAVVHPQAGVYEAIFEFTVPYGSASVDCVFKASIGSPRQTSVFVVPDQGDFREVELEVLETPVSAAIYYPAEEDIVDIELNDHQGGGGGNSTPEYITVEGLGPGSSDSGVTITSEKEVSHVVVVLTDGTEFWDYKYDDLVLEGVGETYTALVPEGYPDGTYITAVYVKSGNNKDGAKGSGYGVFIAADGTYVEGDPFNDSNVMPLDSMAQFCWEDRTEEDNDFNDFVGRLRATEIRDLDGNVVQVFLSVKAVARSTYNDADWQLNIDGDLPGNTVYAIVDQFYADGTRHGDQRIYVCSNGMSVPIFTPIREALPNPPGTYYTNGIPGTDYMDGDYAEITLLLINPQAPDDATPMPFDPELLIDLGDGQTEIISLWQTVGDPVEDGTGIPLAFIVPDTYAWPLEDSNISDTFAGFDEWVSWINGGAAPASNWWDDDPAANTAFDMTLFNAN